MTERRAEYETQSSLNSRTSFPTTAVMFCGVGTEPGTGGAEGCITRGPDLPGGVSGTTMPPPSRLLIERGDNLGGAGGGDGAQSMQEATGTFGVPQDGLTSGDGTTCTPGSGESTESVHARVHSFLQGQGDTVDTQGSFSRPYPRIGEGEMATAHFVVNYRRYRTAGSPDLTKWLVTSVDTDQWMIILLGMGTGKIIVEGPQAVDVTVARHVKKTEYIHVNSVYRSIARLTESNGDAGWPSELPPWLNDGAKSILFVWVFLLSGCDFLPAIARCTFPKMWDSLLRGLALSEFFGDILYHDGPRSCQGQTRKRR